MKAWFVAKASEVARKVANKIFDRDAGNNTHRKGVEFCSSGERYA
jgi:hypothetical protein